MILRIILLWLLVTSATSHLLAITRPTSYSTVPDYRAVAYGNGADLMQSSAYLGREVDATGWYYFHNRYLTDSHQWSSYDPRWNPSDPNGQSYSGGDPINHGDWKGMMATKAGNYAVGLDQGFAQGFFGINTGQPTDTANYNGQAEGRNLAGLVSVWMMYSGPQITDTGLGIMAASGTVEVDSAGTLTIGAGPAFIGGAGTALFGTATTAAGTWGFNNFVNLTPLQTPPQNSGGEPQSALNPNTEPYTEPAPPQYGGGLDPAQPVYDHIDAGAHGGSDDADNIQIISWESNSIKRGREGQLLQYEQYLIDNGMSEMDAATVTASEWKYIQNDVHARAVDPAILDTLPAPETQDP